MNVLVMSISKKVPMLKAVRSALARADDQGLLFGADTNRHCIGSYFVDRFWHCPPLGKLSIRQLIDYCKANGIQVIFPSRDGELAFFSAHRDMLKASGIHVMVSSPDAVAMCMDKLAFAEKLRSAGYHTIPTYADLNFPADGYVAKERYGAGGVRTAINVTAEDALQFSGSLEHPVFQPFIQGTECSVDIYAETGGQVKGIVLRKRQYVVDGESQITTTFRDPDLERIFTDIAQHIGFCGHIMFQMILDAGGQYHLLECNCRFGGASTLSIAAGLDSFYWFMQESMGHSLDRFPFHRCPDEKMLVRHAEDHILVSE